MSRRAMHAGASARARLNVAAAVLAVMSIIAAICAGGLPFGGGSRANGATPTGGTPGWCTPQESDLDLSLTGSSDEWTTDDGVATYVGGNMYIGQSTGATSYSSSNAINGSYAVEAEGLTIVNGKLMSRALKHSWGDRGFRFGVVGFGANYTPKSHSDGLVVGGNDTSNDTSLTLRDNNNTDVNALAWAGDKGQGRMWLGAQPRDDTVSNPKIPPILNARIAGSESQAIGADGWTSDKTSVYSPASEYGQSAINWNATNALANVMQNGTKQDYTGFATEFKNKSAFLESLPTTGTVTVSDADSNAFSRAKYASSGANLQYQFNTSTSNVWVKERKVTFQGNGKPGMQVFTIDASVLNGITSQNLPYTTTGQPSGYTGVDFDFEDIPTAPSGDLAATIVVNVTGGPVDFHNGWRFYMNGNEIGGAFEDNLYASSAQSILWNFTGGDVTIRGGFANAADKHTDDDPAAGMIGSILVSNGSFEDHVSTNGRVYVSGDYSMYNPTKAASFNVAGAQDGDTASVIDMDQERHNFPWSGMSYVACAALTWNKVTAEDGSKKGGSAWGIFSTKEAAESVNTAAVDTSDSAFIAEVTDGDASLDEANKKMPDLASDSASVGIITVSNLTPNATYYIRELSAPTGYSLNKNVYTVTVGAGGTTTRLAGDDGKGNIKDELLPGTVSWSKKAGTVSGADLTGSVWKLSKCTDPDDASIPQNCNIWDDEQSGISSTTAQFTIDGLKPNVLYKLEETAAPVGYATAGPFFFTGHTNASAFFIDAEGRKLAASDSYKYDSDVNVIADARILGTVSWQKVDASSKDPLGGSEWTLTYTPDSTGAASVTYTVSDADGTATCTASAAVLCDEDNTKGSFKLTGLQGGAYTLVEFKAPGGYVIDKTPYHFTISAENQSVVLGNMKNEKAVTALPLTGSVWTPRNVALLGFGLLGVSIVSFVAAQRRRRR